MPTPQPVNNLRESGGREGSPWTGIWAVVGKEMSGHMSSTRMRILVVLIVLSEDVLRWELDFALEDNHLKAPNLDQASPTR